MTLPDATVEARASIGPWIRRSVAALALIGAAGGGVLLRPDRMLVEQVAFEGNDRATHAELRHLVDIRNGTTVWRVDLDAAARGVERHPWVREATARRSFPSTVIVSLREYEPVALLQGDGLTYVDRDGTPFLAARTDDLDYPVLTGIADLGETHPDLPPLAIRDALWLMEALDERELVPRGRVSEVSFSRTRGLTVHVDGGARVVFGFEGYDERVDRLATLLGRGELDPYEPVLVDLAPPSVAIVRPLPLPAAGEG